MTEAQRKRMNGRRWRFGRGQTDREEKAEIESAKRAGLVWDYLEGQRWRRMIEAETERRRALKRSGQKEAHRLWH